MRKKYNGPNRREISNYIMSIEASRAYRTSNKKETVDGPKKIILEVYQKKHDKKAAYMAMHLMNNRIGFEAYTEDIIDSWIEEYEKERVKDDDGR